MNHKLEIEFLKQACEDIKSHAEEIVGTTKFDKNLEISIRLIDEYDECIPMIVINKKFPVTLSDEAQDIIAIEGWK